MTKRCAFCGRRADLTGEHVFPKWMQSLNRDFESVRIVNSALNGFPRTTGEMHPFTSVVRQVCASCNNGWMGDLEGAMKTAILDLVAGTSTDFNPRYASELVRWAFKTALVGMYVSSAADRAAGYGVNRAEYNQLYAAAILGNPLDNVAAWIARTGPQAYSAGGARVLPLSSRVGDTESPRPVGYAISISIGQLLVQGLRLPDPGFSAGRFELADFARVWPEALPEDVPLNVPLIAEPVPLTIATSLIFADSYSEVRLAGWSAVTDLPQSVDLGHEVSMPAYCGRHRVLYPAWMVQLARAGHFFWFTSTCSCGHYYLYRTETTGTHLRGLGTEQQIEGMYQNRAGREIHLSFADGSFRCKRDR